MKKSISHPMRTAHLPFGDWGYFPRKSFNVIRFSHSPDALWKPVHISIALTAECKKSCDFCYAESIREGKTGWTLENLVQIVKSCDQNGVFAITLGGGEPTLWRDRSAKADFYDLLNELSVFGCDISFTSSAIPAVKWKKIPPAILPRLSLHHYRELDFLCNEIKKAVECRGRIPGVNVLVRQGETANILAAAEKLLEVGVRDFLLIPLRPIGRAVGSTLIPTRAELQQLLQSFPIPRVKFSSCYHLDNQKDTFLGCGAGDWFVCIDEQQRVKSCSFIKSGIALTDFNYQAILNALPSLNRLQCHKRIKVAAT